MESEPHMQVDIYNHMPIVMDGMPPQLFPESHFRSSFLQMSTQNDSNTVRLPGGHSFRDVDADKTLNYDGLLDRGNLNYQELSLRGAALASGSLGAFLTCGNAPRNIVHNSVVPLQEVAPDPVRAMYSNDCSYASSSSAPTSLNRGYDSLTGEMNNRWDLNRFLMQQPDLNWRTSTTGLEPIQYNAAQDSHEWVMPNPMNVCSSYESSRSHNELSLSLAPCAPSFPCPESVQEQCPDMSLPTFMHNSQSQRRLNSEHGSQLNKELSLACASSSRSSHSPHIISGSRYRAVLQQILTDVASYSLDNVDHTSHSARLNNPYSSNRLPDPGLSSEGMDEFCDNDGSIEAPTGSSSRKRELESKKAQLLALLQVVDDRYNRCLDEIHTVISAFHAATELDPQLHACFALQSVSYFYKNLRERISNQILAMGMENESRGDTARCFEKSFIQNQWAIQQLKKKDQQLWRPQRGLPERSVSVLRAWMFDNFLHPYPKDAEKHLLAIKSGLTRSQVSNWFINARVRLWKPLVEEMCSELNRRKGSRQNDEGSSNADNSRSQLTIYDFNQTFNA